MVALYDEGGFLKKAVKATRVKPAIGRVSGTFGDVPAEYRLRTELGWRLAYTLEAPRAR